MDHRRGEQRERLADQEAVHDREAEQVVQLGTNADHQGQGAEHPPNAREAMRCGDQR
jgi:hypothetical protein